MVDKEINGRINAELDAIYKSFSAEFLSEWSAAFGAQAPEYINNFGIVDTERYDAERGVLFIGKETNNFSHNHYRDWLYWLSKQSSLCGTDVTPNMWYNAGRWAYALAHPEARVQEIAGQRAESLSHIGTVAFTNVNKVFGRAQSKKEYYRVAFSDVAGKVLLGEIEILKPQTVVCLGTGDVFSHFVGNFDGKVIFMPHPGARKNTQDMIRRLKEQM